MSDAPKKRPLFQIHLATCVVLMFVAGGLVWANIALSPNYADATYVVNQGGWPLTCVSRTVGKRPRADFRSEIEWPRLIFNVVFCTGLLLGAAVASEYILRHLERRESHRSISLLLVVAAFSWANLAPSTEVLPTMVAREWPVPTGVVQRSLYGFPFTMRSDEKDGEYLERTDVAWAACGNVFVALAACATAAFMIGRFRRRERQP